MKIALAIVQLLLSITLIIIVLFQPGKTQGLSGSISGIADTFLSRNKAKSWDVRLAKITTWVAVLFVVLTLALNVL